MSQVMRNPAVRAEFWRPPVDQLHKTAADTTTEICTRCNSEFVLGSRYCHMCGVARNPEVQASHESWLRKASRVLAVARIRQSLNLNTASLVAFGAGLLCILATLLVALVYTDIRTFSDWQAIQLWRIEWLMAAVAAFVAGILLKKNPSS
jgi:ribosomal protein L37E